MKWIRTIWKAVRLFFYLGVFVFLVFVLVGLLDILGFSLSPYYQRAAAYFGVQLRDTDISLEAERINSQTNFLINKEIELLEKEETLLNKESELQAKEEDLVAMLEEYYLRVHDFELIEQQVKDKQANLSKSAQYFLSMPPQDAVNIFVNMTDISLVELFDVVNEQARGTASLVPLWLSLLPPERAAQVGQQMINR